MIKIFCDVCGDEMSKFGMKSDLPDYDGAVDVSDCCNHMCQKCREIRKDINVSELVRRAIIDRRLDIPQAVEV